METNKRACFAMKAAVLVNSAHVSININGNRVDSYDYESSNHIIFPANVNFRITA